MTIGFRSTRARALDEIDPYLPPDAAPIRPRIVDRLYSIVAPLNQPGSRTRRYQLIYSDAFQVARTLNLADAFERMAADISLGTAMMAPKRTFVHAGVVAWRGRAIVLPGAAHTGKTTLVAALVRAGATYYSDEWAVLGTDGRVWPYPRPLAIRGTNGAPDASVSPAALGGRVGSRPVRVGLVLMARFDPVAAWQPRPVTPANATLSALAHVMQTHFQPAKVFSSLARMMAGARILEGTRGEADEVAPAILAALDHDR